VGETFLPGREQSDEGRQSLRWYPRQAWRLEERASHGGKDPGERIVPVLGDRAHRHDRGTIEASARTHLFSQAALPRAGIADDEGKSGSLSRPDLLPTIDQRLEFCLAADQRYSANL
jgi:hypothetical protein